MNFWGYELIIDAKNCKSNVIYDSNKLHNWSVNLVKEIDMIAYGDPIIEHFAEHDEEKAGFTIIQLIETSNITAHFCDKSRDGYINIFSCKEIDIDKTLNYCKMTLQPENLRVNFLTRQA